MSNVGASVIPTLFDMLAEQQAAFLVEQQRNWQRMLSLPRAMDMAQETRSVATPHEIVFERVNSPLRRPRPG